jgi:hypothetical protein
MFNVKFSAMVAQEPSRGCVDGAGVAQAAPTVDTEANLGVGDKGYRNTVFALRLFS